MEGRRYKGDEVLRIKRSSNLWNLHTHSKYSVGDALPTVADLVQTVKSYNQTSLGLTEHGNMASAVQLYKECMKAGIKPFPGTELYVVKDRNDVRAKRHHMCVVAYTTQGYRNLINLNSHANYNFYYKPLIDFNDLAQLSEAGLLKGIAATSGCYFGYIAQAVEAGDDNEARRIMSLMDKWFDNFYVELQNHNIVHDEDLGITDHLMADALMGIANELGIPCVLTQDAHYAHPEDKTNHDTLKRLVAWGNDPDDAVFPGDGFHLADDAWFAEHHKGKRFAAGLEGLVHLSSLHDLSIPELDTYHYNIPFTVADPQKALGMRCMAEAMDRKLGDRYTDRLMDELEIVKDTGMAGYLMLVASVTDWCRDNGIFYQARGSASGSILCWLLGITQVDPIKHELRFERFISRDRMKPPDIDLDVERNRRDELIEWLSKNYAVCQIGTWMEMGMKDEEGKGSLIVKYYAQYNKRHAEKIHEWDEIPEADQLSLRALAHMKPFSAHGTHAAGMIVTTDQSQLDKMVPVMRVGDKKNPRYVSQYEMDDIEALGLVKLDVLGLATLEVLNKCMRNLGRDVADGLDWIPTSDRATFAMIARGNTDGVFQLEGGSARRGVRDLKPSKLDDVIASMALFRPATMNSGATDSFINRKHKKESIPVQSEIIRKHSLKTYGILVYQEQIIAILRDLGMTPDDLTAFLKAVKASNASVGDAAKVIDGYREQVRAMAQEHDIDGDEWEWLWEAIEGFSAYGFNKAHATAYGLTAYRCAYLAHHHPTEFFAALLSVWAGTPKEGQYLRAARQRGMRFRSPSLNGSERSYTVVREGTIMKGLLSVDGIAERTAARIIDNRPKDGYASIDDFCQRNPSISGVKHYMATGELNSGIVGKMNEARMFDTLEG